MTNTCACFLKLAKGGRACAPCDVLPIIKHERECVPVLVCLIFLFHCRQVKNPISWTLWRLPSKASRLLRATMAPMAPCKEAIYNKSSQAIIGTSKSELRSKTWLGVYWGHHGEFIDDIMMFVYWSFIETCNMQYGNSQRKHTSS